MALMPQKPQDAQKGCPARPQRAKRRGGTNRTLWGRSPIQMDLGERKTPSHASSFNVEPLREARTMLADFFSILLETQPDAEQGILGAEIQREFLPVVVGREVFVLAEQKHLFSQIALQSAKELIAQRP